MKNNNLGLLFTLMILSLILSACGGGGGGGGEVAPQPEPTAFVHPTPPPLVADSVDFETAEYNRNYALDVLNASDAYAHGATGNSILVAVIDSGVLADHVDLVGQIAGDSIDIVDPLLPVTDADGHGTNIAGIIAGLKNDSNIHGIAFDSKILAIRAIDRSAGNPVVDDCGNGVGGCSFNLSDLAAAIDYAVGHNARIINFSLGGGKTNSPALDAALIRAVQAGVILVASASNDYGLIDHDNNPGTPDILDPDGLTPDAPANFAGTAAALGRALAVGATDQNNLIASFSNRAGSGDVRNFYLVAPGVNIITSGLSSVNPAARDEFFSASGTSFSSAYVSGAIALLLDAYPNLQPEQAVALLIETATDLGDAGVDDTYGAGIVNLATAFAPVGATTTSFKGLAVPVDISGMFDAPKGAFGDWAEKGGAFVDLVFQDKYQRHFKTDSLAQKVHTTAREIGLLRSYTDRIDNNYSSENFTVNGFNEKGFVKVSLNHKKTWQHGVGNNQTFDSDFLELTEQSYLETDMEVTMHFGALHFGAGRGFSAPVSGSMNTLIKLDGGINSLVGEPNWFYGGYDLNDNITLGFVSNSSETGSLVAFNLEQKFGEHSLISEVGFLNENSNFFGSKLSGRFGEKDNGNSIFYALNWVGPLIGEWYGEGRLELAQGKFDAPDFVAVLKQPISSAWAISLHRPVLKNSIFNFSISQPLRTKSGLISFGAPVDFDQESNEIGYEVRTLELTPSGRELDIKSSLYFPLQYGFSVIAETQFIHNPMHISSANNELISWLSLRGHW